MTSREVVIATVKMAGQSQPMMKEKRLLCFLAAVALSGCGGGGGGATSGVSPSAPSGNPAPVSTPEASSAINEGLLAGVYSSQFSVAAQSSGTRRAEVYDPRTRRAEVYDPRTRSSMVAAFAQATLTTPTASRGGNAYLIASSTFGIAQAARDLLDGIGVANSSYTFLDTSQQQCKHPQRLSENFRQQHRQHPVQSAVYAAGQQTGGWADHQPGRYKEARLDSIRHRL